MIALLFVIAMSSDTLLIDLQLNGTNEHTVVEAILTPDSTLLLPARETYQFLGLPDVGTTWTSVAEIRAKYPVITITVLLRELRIVIDDPLEILPITLRLHE